MNRRVVFDTSSLVSAALRVDSVPYHALRSAMGLYELCASSATLDELERVLSLRKFDRYLDPVSRKQFIELVHAVSQLFAISSADVSAVEPRCRDPKDDKFLALAVAAEAGLLVSSDDDLLVLRPWKNVTILRPGEFLGTIRGPENDAP